MTDAAPLRLLSINVAGVRPLRVEGRTVMSGIGKRAVEGPQRVGPLGLAGDEQADLTVHGGLSKAVYAYPSEHYPFWREARAEAGASLWDEALPPGSLGENLTLQGLRETEVWIGDTLRFPDCTLLVSEPRYPCFKFTAVMGFPQAARRMVQAGCCGWYLRVTRAGSIEAGQAFELVPGRRETALLDVFRRAAPRRLA
jgi:MOSC domain-containing protein YiiM